MEREPEAGNGGAPGSEGEGGSGVRDARALARRHGVSEEAAHLVLESEVVDLHVDTFIPMRLFGYDPHRRHGLGLLRGRHFGHLDLPRMEDAGVTGALWSITTNPFRTARGRYRTLERNARRLREALEARGAAEVVDSRAAWEAARAAGRHGAFLSIQGGNALDAAPVDGPLVPDPAIVRVTLVHLTNSRIGTTSSPFRLGAAGLTAHGRRMVERLDAERVFVDLAHAHPRTFWDAVDVHDRTLPLIATHTGVDGVRPHWRNLDDAQIRAIADTGGVVGIIFHGGFLRRRGGPRDAEMVAEHVCHVLDVGGEDAAALGSDYDGFIVPPVDLRSGTGYVRVVQGLLDRGIQPPVIRKVLGESFLRALAAIRP